jgi:iron complex outermembrane receptor protein
LTGDVNGIEFTANIPLRVISDSLDGFGIAASAAFNDGGLDDGGQIPGMSDEVFQLTAYYENAGFEARVSATDRSGFETETRGGSNSIATAYRKPITLIDAQVSYDFAESGIEYLEGLRVSLQAMNITEENDVNTLAESALLVTGADTYGSTTMLNLNWSF